MGNAPRCPRCGSSNTRKSDDRLLKGGLAHIAEFAAGFGLGRIGMEDVVVNNQDSFDFTQYIDDEFQCRDCGHVWKPGDIYGAVTDVWINHNVENEEGIGMEIHAKFEINGMLNRKGLVAAFFYFENGEPLKDYNNNYCSEDGSVFVSEEFTPGYQNCRYDDFQLFIPNEELHLDKSCSLFCVVYISDGNKWIAQSSQLNIDYQTNGQEVIDNQEFQFFSDEFNQFFENENSIVSSRETLMDYYHKIERILNGYISQAVVRSEYRFLQAFACEEYLYYTNAADTEVSASGEHAINKAIQEYNDDEYIVLKQVLHSYNLRFDANDILSIQKIYDRVCPNIQGLQNTLIKTEYLEQIYNFSRFWSLLSTSESLDGRGKYDQAIDVLKLMLKLDTPLAFITASSHLYYCYFKEKNYESYWNEGIAFSYAKQGADYAIEYMKSNFDPEDRLCKEWMTLVEDTALRYQHGIGIEVNLSEAEKYLMIGIGHGDEECKNLLKELYDSRSGGVQNGPNEGNEREYLDMLKESFEDGEISIRERRMLDKIRISLGISEERAKVLEASLNVLFLSDEEKEYLDSYKEASVDGTVSDKERKLLEKLRVMYGISIERAKQLENIK